MSAERRVASRGPAEDGRGGREQRGLVLNIVIVFIGPLVILNSLVGWISSWTIKSFPSLFSSELRSTSVCKRNPVKA